MSIKKIGWLDIGEKLAIGSTIVSVIAIFVVLFVGIGLENTDVRTIILHDDSGTSYACTTSKADTNPHDCKPIKDTK